MTLTFKNEYRIHCTAVCYCEGSKNKGCICGDRNRGIGLPAALLSNYNNREVIQKNCFRRFPHAMHVTIKVAKENYPPHTIVFRNPYPMLPIQEPPPDPA